MTLDDDGWQRRTNAHARRLEDLLQDLTELAKLDVTRKFWKRAHWVGTLFKSLKPLAEYDRARLWKGYQHLCDKVKSREQRQYADRLRASAEKRKLVEAAIATAQSYIIGVTTQTSLNEAHSFLTYAMHMMRKETRGDSSSADSQSSSPYISVKLVRHDYETCWEQWKKTKEAFDIMCEKVFDSLLFAEFRRKALDALNAAMYGKPRLARQEVNSLYRRLWENPLPEEQSEEIRDILKKTLEKAEEEDLKQREEWKKKNRKWFEKQCRYITSLKHAVTERQKMFARIKSLLEQARENAENSGLTVLPRDLRVWIIKMENRLQGLHKNINDMQTIIKKTTKSLESYKKINNVPEAIVRISFDKFIGEG